jgi:uncharacterized tellurite resistance protein B-like protein
MSVAVMLADDKIDEKELVLIKTMIEKSHRTFDELPLLSLNNKRNSFSRIRNELIIKSIKIAKLKEFNKNLIMPILRALLIVAGSDNKIEKSELKVIYEFAKEFSISKQDIILLLRTQYEN